MGYKRTFDGMDFQHFPFKQARPVDYSNKLTQSPEQISYVDVPQKPDISVGDRGDNFAVFQWHEVEYGVNGMSNSARNLETSAPCSLFTSSSDHEDVRSSLETSSSLPSGHLEYDIPRGRVLPFDTSNSSCLEWSPRKQVPLGPNHQATIPLWGSQVEGIDEESLMGTCIISMPDPVSSSQDSDDAGSGWNNCDCLDDGSVRCVQQHITEAREKLIRSLGQEAFGKLGFYEMGEVVSRKWSEEEERIFRSVIYSYPASLGQNFWKHLSQVFPTRPMKDIVSYYFNVFMLRKRAAQNRSNWMDIDSDEDELPEMNSYSHVVPVPEDDEDSALDSIDQHDHADQLDETLAEENADSDDDEGDDDDDDDGNDDDGDDDDANPDIQEGSGDATGEDSGIDYASEASVPKSRDASEFDNVYKHLDNSKGNFGEDFTVQDDSCMSFEFQADKVDSNSESGLQTGGVESLPGKLDGCSDVMGQVYFLDPYDIKVWDARFRSPIKGVDLLPTCNIIEEIFGQGNGGEQNNDERIN